MRFLKRKINKALKRIDKAIEEAGLKKEWDEFVDEIDKILAYGGNKPCDY